MPKRLVLVAVFLFLVIGLAGRSVEASQMAVVTNPTVNLRGGAGTNHPVVGQAGQGARLPVLGKSGDWVQVRQANGQAVGWPAGWCGWKRLRRLWPRRSRLRRPVDRWRWLPPER
ncbi:SH3 domain-containing protein [Candidatus Desulforudis audaxviator]|uniref:SH3 domain-containing protein n=1 Tax=Candidatus Desulforudis audaxviator TaxID=471827 RepID=UPI00191E552F|nr:SH3 domain-containing protein [Candidatus Desulforudis audaxviator]